MKLAVGGEVFYRVSPKARVSLAVLKDVYARNATEGVLMVSRIAMPFN